MKKSNSKSKALGAFKKLGAVALITATLAMCFTACKQTGGGNSGGGGGGSVVKDGAVLTLSPDHLTIKVTAKTEDGSAIQVEGCTETTFASNTETTLHAKGTTVILKGKIIQLNCGNNKLTALNVQGLTALKQFGCFGNKLNAQAMTELLNALPAREAGDNAMAVLYTEFSGEEGNCKDYTNPPELKDAFDGAKKRNWTLWKYNASGSGVYI